MKNKIIFALLVLVSLGLSYNTNFEPAETSIEIYPGWNLISSDINWNLSACAETVIQNPIIYSLETNTYYSSAKDSETKTVNPSVHWYYSKNKCSLFLKKISYGNMYQLEKGQNYITVTTEISSKTLYKMQNDCKITRTYYYDAKSKQWTKIYLGTNLTKLTGYGIMIETKKECTLKISA